MSTSDIAPSHNLLESSLMQPNTAKLSAAWGDEKRQKLWGELSFACIELGYEFLKNNKEATFRDLFVFNKL